ncbi:MAG: hypothetical protein GX786_01080, partial [Clostridiales bacterium]|nr:hypothetical protein [Clostridiales bacterium]
SQINPAVLPNETGEFSPNKVQAFLKITTAWDEGENITYPPIPLLSENTLTLRQKDGRVNTIAYTPTSFKMEYSTCKGQDCIHQGEVTLKNREQRSLTNSVVCLPNQITVLLLTPEEANTAWELYYAQQQ